MPFAAALPHPHRLVEAGLMLASTCAATLALPLAVTFEGDRPALPIVVALSTALLTYALVRAIRHVRQRGYGTLGCLLLGPALGALNVGVSLMLLRFLDGQLGAGFGLLLFGTLIAGVYGAAFGVLWGAVFAACLALMGRLTRRSGHAAPETALFVIGGGLMLLGGALSVPGVQPDTDAPASAIASEVAAWVLLFSGAASALGGAGFLARRGRWLRRVRAGRVFGYAIGPRSEHPPGALAELSPFTAGPRRGEVLLRRRPPSFREADEAIALL